MTKCIFISALLAMVPLWSTPASAAVIAECGASIGYEYYFGGSVVPEKERGWQKGGISKGQIILIVDGDKPRIIFKDAIGTTDTQSEGASAHIVGIQNNIIAVLVTYPMGTIETYLFKVDPKGVSEVVWGTFRFHEFVHKGSVFRAECRPGPGR